MPACELDPEIEIFVRTMTQSWSEYPPVRSVPLPQARVIAEKVREPWTRGGPEMRDVFERHVSTASGPLRVRIYNPGLDAPAGMLIYLHGGGWTFFSLDTHDRLMREYAAAAGCIVVGVDYPLSPEARYPIALDALIEMIDWLVDGGAAEIGGDPRRIAIGGDSAGGNLALAAALRLRDRGSRDLLSGVLLNYGGFSGRCSDQAEARYGGPGSVLDRAEMGYYFENYCGQGVDQIDDPYACPNTADFKGLPPAMFIIPECDILSEQSYDVAERMKAAGVAVESRVYAGATHSFLEAMSIASIARRAIADGAAWVRAQLREPLAPIA